MRSKKIYSLLVAFSLAIFYGMIVYGQSSGEKEYSKDDFIRVMKEMVGRYRDSKALSFDIMYKYASEQNPGLYLDSLKGSYRINGSDYWYSLDNTEVASNQEYSVLLFKEDHIMYLAPAKGRNTNMDFLAGLDSFLVHHDNIVVRFSEDAQWRMIQLSFGDNSPWKSIGYSVDKKSGYITRIRQVVKSSRLYDPTTAGKQAEADHSYAIVDMDFTGYRTGAFDARQLDIGNYFRKEGGQFVTTAPYNEYKIFLGAPNL